MSIFQWICTKLGMCIDIMEIWFGIANLQILSVFNRVTCPPHERGGVLSFHVFIFMQLSLRILSRIANSGDPDQTAPSGSGSALFAYAVL